VSVGVGVSVGVSVGVGVNTRHKPVGEHSASTTKTPGVQSVPEATSAQ
jgi:hypothetical protein